MQSFTTKPLTVAVGVEVQPEFIRLPGPGERDPVFGLSRSFMNALVLPTPDNKFKPPVKSAVLRSRGARTGVRLVQLDSLRAYVYAHMEQSAEAKPTELSPNFSI